MHHQRRKSGHASANTSMTDVRKAVNVSDLASKHKSQRPALGTRKSTSQTVHMLGKSPREREREWEEERNWEEERESFPQFCMTCEKQFLPQDERFLYCSEECRHNDQNSATATLFSASSHPNHTNYPFFSDAHPEPRDIIPRASPSRPSSLHLSPPATPDATGHTTAISALRSLTIRPPSPPSPTGTYHSSIWPFGGRSPMASPGTSYSKAAPKAFSSTYDGGYYGGAVTYGLAPSGLDRPLPSRRPGVHSRPKSIELVTPIMTR
ncbi:hypothetical protein VTK73DRAFT_3384 [Phialemonium thermophilum]|uniref:Life-span regulatory factor domain-containing protein n=1 Tax=Phialemonium thermophilum TaxID=223376 RepID=A0ABR3WZF5_9PEZI